MKLVVIAVVSLLSAVSALILPGRALTHSRRALVMVQAVVKQPGHVAPQGVSRFTPPSSGESEPLVEAPVWFFGDGETGKQLLGKDDYKHKKKFLGGKVLS